MHFHFSASILGNIKARVNSLGILLHYHGDCLCTEVGDIDVIFKVIGFIFLTCHMKCCFQWAVPYFTDNSKHIGPTQ